jgi:putative redox protein
MVIRTLMLADELFESANDNNNRVKIDMRPREEKEGQSPVELLLSAVAGCAAVDIVVMLKKRRKTIGQFEILTDGTRQESTPRSFTKIHSHYRITSPDVQESELHKVAGLALEKYCSVAASLKSELSYSVEVIRA